MLGGATHGRDVAEVALDQFRAGILSTDCRIDMLTVGKAVSGDDLLRRTRRQHRAVVSDAMRVGWAGISEPLADVLNQLGFAK